MFFWDYKNNGIGLKIIKQYFKLLQEKIEKEEYEECKICYGKLILFLIDSSVGKDDANFSYEDLLAKIDKNFDKFIKNYFICLVKTCEIKELTERVADYAIRLERAGYGFDSDRNIILINELDGEILKNLEKRLLIKTEGMTKRDQDKIDLIYFLLEIACSQYSNQKKIYFLKEFIFDKPPEKLNFLVEYISIDYLKDKLMNS